MWRLITIWSCFLSFVHLANAQDVISNGNFEEKEDCPSTISQINLTTYWISPNEGTPDYFNACHADMSPKYVHEECPDVPVNYQGTLEAKSGDGYAGLCVWGTTEQGELREYLQTALKSRMEARTTYCIKFYVALSEKSVYAIHSIGVYFSSEAPGSIDQLALTGIVPNLVHADKQYLISTEWTPICFTYGATGEEKYMTLGNFVNNSYTDKITIGALSTKIGANWAYYYIDDISVMPANSSSGCDCAN